MAAKNHPPRLLGAEYKKTPLFGLRQKAPIVGLYEKKRVSGIKGGNPDIYTEYPPPPSWISGRISQQQFNW